MKYRFVFYFYLIFSLSIAGFSCTFCKVNEQRDCSLNVSYCPKCVNRYRGFWHYFLSFTKNKRKHISESYFSQYTVFDLMNKSFYELSLKDYEENVFVEFAGAVWEKISNNDFNFKNPDLENVFFDLFEKEPIFTEKNYYEKLSCFYCTLKWMCLALYYECQPNFHENYAREMYLLLQKINRMIFYIKSLKR